MRLRNDDQAASPLVVLTTFVLVAVLVTIAVYALVVDRPEPEIALTPVHDEGALAFDVTRSGGSLVWADLDIRFIDRAGVDVSETYLRIPTGAVDRDDRIGVAPAPPTGTYLLQVFSDGEELVRLAVTV